ncbi:Homoserine dehydrogenase [Lutibaculum baratangense AMV1]|uniref:Homoserine dehydrogenase n=1 Tax=Lutibaculum baratangense AMV1 TaxID=631454 RepID=V4RJ64_9HYPH|nr:Homoserine dehydrogenase [Lutibaculum baratangense AMV1]
MGIAGLGTVGASVVRLLGDKTDHLSKRSGRDVAVTAVCARDRGRDRGVSLDGLSWHDDPVALAESDGIDLFVELMGGEGDPAAAAVSTALRRGRPVVTANKALLAARGTELARLAEENGTTIGFEAAVAGGIPIVKTMREAMAGNRVERVYGILNGTCNYILTRMEEEGLSFADCLAEAQRLGYAEADPTFDIEGHDSAHKLALLSSLAFGVTTDFDSIHLEGIASITTEDLKAAAELGYRIKLLGVARRTDTGIEQRVTPTMMPRNLALANVDGVLNAVAVDGDEVGEITMVGPGAGGSATASAVVADIVDIARGRCLPVFGIPAAELEPYRRARMRKHAGGYYIRLSVYDRPGAFAAIAQRMAEEQISLESIVQKEAKGAKGAQSARRVVLITHDTMEAQIRKALQAIEDDGQIAERPHVIRIEKP